MGTIDENKVIIQSLQNDWCCNKVAAADMLRLDLVHPVVSGNKWFKLRLNMKHAVESGAKNIVTFGGGYSNHLISTAYIARMFGIHAIGIVRGKYDVLTPTLQACKDEGMELIFISKEDYKSKDEPDWEKKLAEHFDELFIIPEGGANEWGRAGAGLIGRFINDSYTHVAVSVGTGTTLIGLKNKISAHRQLLGFAPMKQGAYLHEYINSHIHADNNNNWQLFDEWHFGGFGKWNDELVSFMNDFYRVNNIPLDIVYTSKMMYGLQQMILSDFFPKDARILCIHTGGLQGNTTAEKKLCY